MRGSLDAPAAKLAPDFSFADLPTGERVTFTRSERRLLGALAANPDRIVTRDQLLDAVSGTGTDKNDRNIDFLINRLRRKLADDARSPRYIATRYGEGYVWIVEQKASPARLADAFLVVGPLLGLENLGPNRSVADRFAEMLRASLQRELHADQRVVLARHCPPAAEFAGRMPSLSITLGFFDAGGVPCCVATAREFRTGRILAIRRIAAVADMPSMLEQATENLARALLDETWRTLAAETAAGTPLPVLVQGASMYVASGRPADPDDGAPVTDRHLQRLRALEESKALAIWKSNERRLLSLRQASPDDPALKVMYATQIHSKYIMLGHTLFRAGIDDRRHDEDEIESLVLGALPHVQAQPELAIQAAKLLNFLDRGFDGLATSLAEESYKASVSAAGSLAAIGQLRAFAGDTEQALHCLDQALNLVQRGSTEHLYTLTMKMQALRAVADFERLGEAKREFYAVSPAGALFVEPMFANPDKLSFLAKAVSMLLTRERAAAFLKHVNYVSARLFRNPEHRANVLMTSLTLAVRRFGRSVVAEEIAEQDADLLERVR